MHELNQLVHALSHLTHELREDREQRKHDNNKAILERLAQMEKHIMASQAETAAELRLANTQLRKLIEDTSGLQPAMDALKAQIVILEALVAAGSATAEELAAAVAETKALVQTVDDNIPERPVLPPPTS